MKNFINSKYLTWALLLLGVLSFTVLFPSFWSGSGNKLYATLAAILGIYVSFFLTILHFFWIREKKIGFQRFLHAISKAFAAYFLLLALFLIYQYNFGTIYGGKYYWRKSFLGEARINLSHYYQEQFEQMKYTKVFSLDLHKGDRYSSGKFKYGTAEEDEFIKQKCPDCLIRPHSFKLAAYAQYNEGVFFITISNNSKKLDFILGEDK